MAIEKSSLNNKDIIAILNDEYGINEIKQICKLDQGSSNIYIIDSRLGKFILKEYNSTKDIGSVEKEIKIVNYLKSKGLSVPKFNVKITGDYISIYNNKIIVVQDFINGYTIKNNTGDKLKTIQSAQLLGKIVSLLKEYENLSEEQCMVKIFSREALAKSIGIIEKEYKNISPSNKYKEMYMRDLQDKINMGRKMLENFDFKIMNNLTKSNSHGDFSVRQLIYGDSNNVSVIDFETAKKMPITWEVIRSYSYIDEKAQNAEFDINNLVDYYKEFNNYVSLNEDDLRYAPHIYLIQLVGSAFGYREYNIDDTQEELLQFGKFRTKLCRYLFNNADDIGEQLVSRVKDKK